MSHGHDTVDTPPVEVTAGVMAEFDTPDALKAACKKVRDAGYTKWDAHTPYPIHGLDGDMGVKMTRLPWVVFFMGCTGFAAATLLQAWTNGIDYQMHISGKPLIGWPSMGPVMFEVTVLFSALTALGTMLLFNNLPNWFHPAFKVEAFRNVTSHKFFIIIEAKDPKFSENGAQEFLKSLHAEKVTVLTAPSKAAPPRILIYAGVIAVCASLVPMALIYRARHTHSESVKIHIIDDMDFQPKFRAQQVSTFYADKAANRPAPAGTVAWGELNENTHLVTGKKDGKFENGFPAGFTIDEAAMKQGKKMFGIYCAACHGYAGNGDGMVHQRAIDLQEPAWVPPTNLAGDTTVKLTDGQLFDAISNGIRNMQGYSSQIVPKDRWAIVLYLRALQKAQPVVPAAPAKTADAGAGVEVGAK